MRAKNRVIQIPLFNKKNNVFKEDKRKVDRKSTNHSILTEDLAKPHIEPKNDNEEEEISDLMDTSFDFKEENKDHQKLFNKRAKFSYITLFIYIGYIYSFILENRSQDLENMNDTIESLIKERVNIYTSVSGKGFEDVISMGDAYNYVIDRLHFIYLNMEPKADRSYKKSILHHYPANHYEYVHLNFLQTFNILYGAICTVVSDEGLKYSWFFNSTLDDAGFLKEVTKFTKEMSYRVSKKDIPRVRKVQLEFIYYNHNIEASIVYKFLFELNLRKGFTKSFTKGMFLPRFNDPSSNYYPRQRIVWLIRLIYLVYFFFFSMSLVFGSVFKSIKKSISQKSILIEWSDLIYLAYVIVNTNYFIQYYKLLMSHLLFNGVPIDDRRTFKMWTSMAQQQKEIYKYNGFLTIFLIIRLMDLIQIKFFESLRIVFYSFAATSDLLIAFFLAVGLFLIAFLAYSNLVLVEYERSFTDFYKTFEIVALSIFQDYAFPRSSLVEYLDDNYITPIFFFMMFIIFNTFSMQFFIAIIVSSYSVMRRKYQNALEALAKLEKREETRAGKKILSMILFKTYSKFDYENGLKEKMEEDSSSSEAANSATQSHSESSSDSDEDLAKKTDDEKMRGYQLKRKKKKKKKKRWQKRVETKKMKDIFTDNYEDLFGGQAENEFISRDQHVNLVKKLKKNIKKKKKRKLKLQGEELKRDKVSNFGKFLIYLFYIFLFMMSVSRHLSISNRFSIFTSITDDIRATPIIVPNSLKKLNFYQIKTISDYTSWVHNFTESFSRHRGTGKFMALAKYNYHLSFITGKFFYSKKPLDDIIIKLNNGTTHGEYKKNSSVVHYLADKKHSTQRRNIHDTMKHIKLNFSTNYDGIMLYMSLKKLKDDNQIRYLSTKEFNEIFTRLKMMDVDTVKSGIETVFVNLNRNLLTYIEFGVDVYRSGGIFPKVEINTLPMNPYKIGFLSYLGEIIWLTIFINYIYTITKMISEIYNKPKLRAVTECYESLQDRDFFSRILNKPVEEVENFSEAFYRIISRIYKSLKRVIKTFTIFISTKTLYCFHLVSIILTTIALFYWARIVSLSYDERLKVDYMLQKKSGDKEKEIFMLMKQLANLITMYRKLQGINAIFLVCGIFPYFSFSLKLSVALHVTRLAKRDLVSYISIFLIIVFGFGIGGYMIYGDKLENFNSVLRSSLEIILMTIGGVNYELMKSAEAFVTPFFVFTYLIAAYIIFLKMFIVILDATYKDLINHVEKEDVTFLAYINELLKGLVSNIDVYMKHVSREEIEEKYRDKTGFINRIKKCFEHFYNGFIKKIEIKFWVSIKTIMSLKNRNYKSSKIEEGKELLDSYSMYKKLRNSEIPPKISLQNSVERFQNFQSLKGFLSVYYTEAGIKNKKSNGVSKDSKEDTNMNEWFNTLSEYIESTTNKKYSLHTVNENKSGSNKREVLFSILAISSINSFRKKKKISLNCSLEELEKILLNKIGTEFESKKDPKKKKKKSNKAIKKKLVKKINKKGKEKPADLSGSEILERSQYLDLSTMKKEMKMEEETDILGTKINPQFKELSNYLKLMIYHIYSTIQSKSIDLSSDSEDSSVAEFHISKSNTNLNSRMGNSKKSMIEKKISPITLYKAYMTLMHRENFFKFLYSIWRKIPKLLKFNFWIQNNNSEYLTIHQKFFIFTSIPLTATFKRELFIFQDMNSMLLFFKLTKKKKNKVDRKFMNMFTYKQLGSVTQNGQVLDKVSVKMKSVEARKSENYVSDFEVITEMFGIDFFKKIAKAKTSEERLSVCNSKLEIDTVKRVEIFHLWFALELKDRISILLLLKNERLYDLLCSTMTGEVIFGDFVHSIDSLRYLNESINRQLFDLFLLNSQNKATRVSFEKANKKKKDDYTIEKLQEYKKFLESTTAQLKSTLDHYEGSIEKLLEEGRYDYISAFKQAALRYIDIRNIENVNFAELMRNEQDQVLSHSLWGISQLSNLSVSHLEHMSKISENSEDKKNLENLRRGSVKKSILISERNLGVDGVKDGDDIETERKGLIEDGEDSPRGGYRQEDSDGNKINIVNLLKRD